MPPESVRAISSRRSHRCNSFRYFSARRIATERGHTIVAGLIDQRCSSIFQIQVEIEFLRNHADAGLRGFPVPIQVVPEHRYAAAGLVDQGGDDADGRGLARAIGSQQRKEIASRHGQIDTRQRLDAIRVDLAKLLQLQGVQLTILPTQPGTGPVGDSFYSPRAHISPVLR